MTDVLLPLSSDDEIRRLRLQESIDASSKKPRLAKPDALKARPLTLTLPYVPDTSLTSGNARGHWTRQYRITRTEKENWAWYLLMALNQLPGKHPRYERLTVKVTLIYPTKRRRDLDNLQAALKPLWDTFVDLGLLPDDNAERLTVEPPVILVDKVRGPATVLELKDVSA